MSGELKCPICEKVIGKRVTDGWHDSGGLGMIQMCHSEYDYRKASHVWWHIRFKSGILCRKCAKEKFPDGSYYMVTFLDHGKESHTLIGGVDGNGMYADRQIAEQHAKDMTKKIGIQYWVKEYKV